MVLPDQMKVPVHSSLADINHLCGALIVVIAVISMAEVVRCLRFINIIVGAGLSILPWFLINASDQLKALDIVAGILLIACSIPRGIKKERYGLWDKYVF